jgi:large conductance mechanosensitive channel
VILKSGCSAISPNFEKNIDKARQKGYNIFINKLTGGFMKKFFSEFKKFITRGNVLDMAVGVIVGGAFTAIVNGLSNFVLKPIINWFLAELFGADSLSELYTVLTGVYIKDEAGKTVLDTANSIYIDWGAFINAIINFLLIAIVLFTIVKVLNKVREEHIEWGEKKLKKRLSKAQKKELKAAGIKRRDKAAVKAYFDEKARLEKEAAEKAAAEAAAAAAAERAANPTTEDLLKQIIVLLQNK